MVSIVVGLILGQANYQQYIELFFDDTIPRFAHHISGSDFPFIEIPKKLDFMVPLAKLVPVFLWVRPDGTVDSEVSISRLPATQDRAVINASLWEYVRLREGYTADTAQYAYDLVSSFSAPAVQQQYQDFFNYPNPTSPQVTVGKRGKLEVAHISSNDLSPDVQQIRYKRTLIVDGQMPIVTTWTATIRYERLMGLSGQSRLTNPGGLLVTSYQASEDTVSNLGFVQP